MSKAGEENELPEDFFNELADEKFLEDVIDNDDADDEQYARCMAEINVLTKDIERRKLKIKESSINFEKTHEQLRKTHGRSRSPSESTSRRRDKRRRSGDRSPHSRSPHGSRHGRSRDKRFRDRSPSPGRLRRPRRSGSRSPHRIKRSSSTHKNMTFLEELAQKFAEKGQAFPERDALLMGQNNLNSNLKMELNAGPMPFMNNGMPPFDQPMLPQPMMPVQNFLPQDNYPLFYGMNPMNMLGPNAGPPLHPNVVPFAGIRASREIPLEGNEQNLPQPMGPAVLHNKKALIDRCEQAIKLIRAKDNKVPVMKFQYNRTSLVVNDKAANAVKKSPLQAHSTSNVLFPLNAPPSANESMKSQAGLKVLPRRLKEVAISLGINSSMLFDRMRTKELNAQITDQIKSDQIKSDPVSREILVQTTTEPLPTTETAETSTQTVEQKCEPCEDRNRRVMVSAHTQVFLKKSSIGVQTNEKDYREPIVELLSKMTAAQLVAIKDFATLIEEPRPQNSVEIFKVRERLMDMYNLSQRDSDAVRTAEEARLDDVQYVDQLRFRAGNDAFQDGMSRDFERRSNSPRFNGGMMDRSNFGNFDRNDFSNDRMIDDRMQQQRMMDERLGMDSPFQRIRPDDAEEMERQRWNLELERRRELELEINQRQYDEQMEMQRREMEEERRQVQQVGFQAQLNRSNQFDMDTRQFNRDKGDRDMPRQHSFNHSRGTVNKRGRGAFRDNCRGRGGRRN